MHLDEVLRRPLITEKSTVLQTQGKYAFEVAKGASKPQIKQAVEKAFDVEVTAVNVMVVAGERRRMGRWQIPARSWKKAIVTLKPGDKIELFETTGRVRVPLRFGLTCEVASCVRCARARSSHRTNRLM